MKHYFYLFALTFLAACSSGKTEKTTSATEEIPVPAGYSEVSDPQRKDFLSAVSNDETLETGSSWGYVDNKGDTVIKIGTYDHCFTGKFRTYAWVSDSGLKEKEIVAIGRDGKVLFDAYIYDNGPDYSCEGLFRIKRAGKIGYANENGEVVIPAQYSCADPFENGKARVTFNCETHSNGEHTSQKSSTWIFIDKTGKEVK